MCRALGGDAPAQVRIKKAFTDDVDEVELSVAHQPFGADGIVGGAGS